MALQLAGQWADWLLHFFSMQVLFSGILFIIIAVLAHLFKNRSRLLLLGLWTLVFVRLILPLEWSHGFSGRILLEQWLSFPKSVEANVINSASDIHQNIYFPTGVITTENRSFDLSILLLGLWGAGVLVLGGLYVNRLIRYKRMIGQSESCSNPVLLEVVELWRQEFGVRRHVRIVNGQSEKPPFTLGIIKPVIYIPQTLCERSDAATLESIIAHELVHIKNCDDLWIRLQHLIQIVYFFNPVVWLAGIQLGYVREQFCDALVLSKQRLSKEVYGNSLLDIVQYNLNANPLYLMPAFAGQKGRLTDRIRQLGKNTGISRWQFISSLSVILLLGFMLLPMGASSVSNASSSGSLISPVPNGLIWLEFGKDWDPKQQKYMDHTGIDIGTSHYPKNIVAAADGKIISTGEDEIFQGNREITIQHANGLKTRYLHMATVSIKPGENVKQGQVIGQAPFCVHFEVYKHGLLKNPKDFLTLEKQLVRSVVKES